jgi:hypothetical protein
MKYPLVRDLAADKIPVAVICRVLGFLQAGVLRLVQESRVAAGLGRGAPDPRYLAAHPELVAEPARAAFPAAARRALLGGLVYLAAIAVAFLSPTASFAIDAIVAVYFAASKSKVPGLIVRSADADGSS